MDEGGTYTLLVTLPEEVKIGVGALGKHEFSAGAYAYTGSALGSGGFARVDRHRRLARGESDARHWHVDYLIGHPEATLREVVTSPGADVECAVADRLGEGPVPGFGASDCGCSTHLAHENTLDKLREAVEKAHEAATTGPGDS